MTVDRIKLICPAKVNLALSVGAPGSEPNADNRMHPICSWMVAVRFGDTLSLTRIEGESVFEIKDDSPWGQAVDWPLDKDLAFRAHGLMQVHVGRALPVDALLEKRIPSGAGLGGGSSDAAGMLVGLNEIYSLGLNNQALFDLGMRLGSDVGFLIKAQQGVRSAIVGGYGEEVEAVSIRDGMQVVLILPKLHCSTADVYGAFDKICPAAQIDSQRLRGLVEAGCLSGARLFNDLAAAAFKVEPELRDLHEKLSGLLAVPVHVSGSGAAMFVVTGSWEEAAVVAELVQGTGITVLMTGVV